MSAQTVQFAADVAAIEPECPVTFRANALTYTGQRTPVMDRQAMEDAGFAQSFDFQLIVRTGIFIAPIKPLKVQDEIEVYDDLRREWIAYRVVSREPSQDGVTITYSVAQSK